MKNRLFLIFAAALLFCGCDYFLESEKEKLDRLVVAHWENWKSEGKDTTKCILDFAEIIPFEWDTMVYVYYDGSINFDNNILKDYMNNHYWKENEDYRGYREESIHFWKDGELVHRISLLIASDDEKGVFFCTKSDLIKRGYNDAKFHVKRKGVFYIIRDMTEEFRHTWRYIQD